MYTNSLLKIVFLFLLTNFLFANELEKKVEKQEKKIDSLSKKIKQLETSQFENKIVIAKDIEFLYRLNIDKNYVFKKIDTSELCENNEFLAIEFDSGFLALNDQSKVICIDKRNKKKNTLEFEDVDLYKLNALEEKLNITNKKEDIKERIKEIYQVSNYSNWDKDRIRFIIVTNYLEKEETVVPSIGVMVFPSYKKYIPGNFALAQRTALYLSYGAKDEIKSVYTTGLNFELQEGFGLNLGYSIYEKENLNKDSFSFGFVLSSELWEKLFTNK